MDRRVVLDGGRIVEQRTHDELLRLEGHGVSLWRRQSGGFLAIDPDTPLKSPLWPLET